MMLSRSKKLVMAVLCWLGRRPGYILLTAGDEQLAAENAGRFNYAWLDLLAISLGWSLASVGIWGFAWMLFGEPFGRIIPAMTVTAVFCLWLYRRAVVSLIHTLFPPEPTSRAIAGAVWVMLLATALVSLERNFRPDAYLPDYIAWFRPWVKIYRVLILMPLWGAWAMMVTPQFCRPGTDTPPAVAAFARGCGPVIVAPIMGLLLAVTITYFNFLPWEQLSISATAILTAIISGLVFCRLTGGLTRRALLAANIVTQLAFITAYLSAQNLLRW